MKAIELKAVSYAYQHLGLPAVNQVSLSVPTSSCTVIIGTSGCGKSTLLRLIAGSLAPQQGTISKPQAVAMVFQGGALLPWLTAAENIDLVLKPKIRSAKVRTATIKRLLKLMGIEKFQAALPRELSGGQKQRLGIARALAIEPQLLLLDEPFSALDVETIRALRAELLKIWEATQMTILMVSHSIEEAVLLADQIIVMRHGKIRRKLAVKLARPRSETDPQVLALSRRLKKLI